MQTVARREVRVQLTRGSVTAILTTPGTPRGPAFVLGHGAGGTVDTPLVAQVAHGLTSRGFPVLRYNFPFAEAGRRRPDFPRVLQIATAAAVSTAQRELGGCSVVIGGKSLGGRMSSHLVADGRVTAAGLLLLGYPLHPPGRPDTLRDVHLPDIRAPMLWVEGTRDPYAQRDLLEATIASLRGGGSRLDVHVVEGGDHDLRVRGRAYGDVVEEVVDAVAAWAADSCG